MERPIIVSASILCADFTRLGEAVRRCEEAGVDRLHIDVMDGHFVPNITIGPLIVEAVRPHTSLPLEVHLMIEHPWAYLESFMSAGADILAWHAECYGPRRPSCREWDRYPKEVDSIDTQVVTADIERVRSCGKKAFLVLNPGTPLCLDPVLDRLDGVLVMSVNPGFARQSFRPEVLEKIRSLRRGFHGEIAVDGGVNAETAGPVAAAGADVLVTASYLFAAEDMKRAVELLKGGGGKA